MTPYYQDPQVTLYQGHVLDVLQALPEESVHCVVTSPPYWGLRDYGIEPQVWGGAAGCAHAWESETVATEVGRGNWAQGVNGRGEEQPGGVAGKREPIRASATRGTCSRCGAWRGSLGLEPTPDLYVAHMVDVFRAVRRVLRPEGTVWLNLGDSYAGSWGNQGRTEGRGSQRPIQGPMLSEVHDGRYPDKGSGTGTVPPGLKPKDLVGIPWRVAFALQADGWYLRADIIWAKPNPMPESVTDRPTKAHEMVFLLAKSPRYFYDAEAVKRPLSPKTLTWSTTPRKGTGVESTGEKLNAWMEAHGGRYHPPTANLRSVWTIATQPFSARSLGVGADGSGRIVSPDCPAHGGRDRSASTAGRDERRDASGSGHSPRTDGDPAPMPPAEPAPTPRPPVEDCAPGSSDSPALACAETATQHSKGTHRTAPAPGTSLHATGGAASDARTADNEPRPERAATSVRTSVSSSAGDDGADGLRSDPWVQTDHRSVGKCTCSIIDHFATFPPALVKPCVLAGTSERGYCRQCGAPWERVVTKERTFESGSGRAGHIPAGKHGTGLQGGGATLDIRRGPVVHATTRGWTPTCRCRDQRGQTIPAVVLDPFGGSGTVGAVARDHGRRAVLIDLKPEYLALAQRRLVQGVLG